MSSLPTGDFCFLGAQLTKGLLEVHHILFLAHERSFLVMTALMGQLSSFSLRKCGICEGYYAFPLSFHTGKDFY